MPVRTSLNFIKSWNTRCKRPFKLTLSLTDKCNSRCLHCGIWKQGSKIDLPLNIIENLFASYPYFTWIDLTGGEIFMRQDLIEAISIIINKTRKLEYLHFPTNALCVDTFEKILAIRKIFKGRLVITVSVDGTEAVHDHVRGVKGGFNKAIELINKLKAASFPATDVYAGMTLFSENAGNVIETESALSKTIYKFRTKDLHVNFAHVSNYYKNIDDFRPMPGKHSAIQTLEKRGGYGLFALLEKGFRRLYEQYETTGKCPIPCRSGEVSLYIDYSANMKVCTMWDINGVSLEKYGFDINKAIDSPEFKKLLEAVKNNGCVQCFTPCEAYQTILSSPLKSLRSFFF